MVNMLRHFDFSDFSARAFHGPGNSTRTRASGNHSRRPARREGRETNDDEGTRRREPDGVSERIWRISACPDDGVNAAREAKPPRRDSFSEASDSPSEVGREEQDHRARQVVPTASLGAQFFARAPRGPGLPRPHADLTTKGTNP